MDVCASVNELCDGCGLRLTGGHALGENLFLVTDRVHVKQGILRAGRVRPFLVRDRVREGGVDILLEFAFNRHFDNPFDENDSARRTKLSLGRQECIDTVEGEAGGDGHGEEAGVMREVVGCGHDVGLLE